MHVSICIDNEFINIHAILCTRGIVHYSVFVTRVPDKINTSRQRKANVKTHIYTYVYSWFDYILYYYAVKKKKLKKPIIIISK